MTTAYVTHPLYIDHDFPGHPEHAGRIKAVWRELESSGITPRLLKLTPDEISDAQVLSVHTEGYLNILNMLPIQERTIMLDPDTYALPETGEIARLSAGGVVLAVDAVMTGQAQNAMACVRPPGHHALVERGMGFCILGNVPIAVKHAQKKYGVERVLVVDFDVHHGNGTQDMFYSDPSVLFISTHQYPFYPGTGRAEETGAGQGKGATLNIPLPPGTGDKGFMRVYEQLVWPAARRFRPELIVVSAGFDAHWRDPLAQLRLSLTGYAHLTRELKLMADELCGGKIVFAMEGGYDLEALAHGWRNIAHVLLGESEISDPLGFRQGEEPNLQPLIDYLHGLHTL
ncbi:MAG: histone deacetylase [Chloroflexi bacterium]|nr:histone deacetylase [Chloroflexota bacterium]